MVCSASDLGRIAGERSRAHAAQVSPAHASRGLAVALPDWRVTCFFVDPQEVLAEIAQSGADWWRPVPRIPGINGCQQRLCVPEL